MIFQLSVFTDIGFAIWQAIRSLIGVIAGALYGYIVDLYNVFMIIARADILDNKYIQLIYNRVGMLLGLFMLFKLSFTLIQSLIDPDKLTDKKKGFANVIFRSIIAIVLLGITPTLFRTAREFQNLVVGSRDDSNNVLYRIIVADDVVSGTTAGFGQKLSSDLFFSFFREKEGIRYMGDVRIEDNDGNKAFVYEDYDTIKKDVENGNISFSELVPYLSLRDNGTYVFHWDIILSIGVAIAVLWILVNYCISVAIRVIQLAYLQLVAPIPILSYIGDPEGAFKKWVKQCTSTYLDLFLRLIILYFIVTLANKALDIINSVEFLNSTGLKENTDKFVLVKVFLLIGLLMFGKKVPELLKELFPGDGKFDLGIKSPKKLLSEIPGAKATVGVGTGVALGAAGSAVGGLGHGLVNMKKAWQDNKGSGGKRFGKTLGAGAKGLGLSVAGGVAGGLSGVKNYKGGLGGAYKLGMKNLNAPLKEDIDSWKKHRSDWKEANAEIKERNEFINYGESLYDYIKKNSPFGEKPDESKAYSNSEYIRTWKAKKAAGDARDQAKVDLDVARANMQRAYNFGTEVEQKDAQDKLLKIQKAYDKAEKVYEGKEAEHKISQKKYAADFKRESAIKAYKSSDRFDEEPSTDSNQAVTTNYQNMNEGNQPDIVNNLIPNPSPQQENDNQSVSNERTVEEQSPANNQIEHVIPTDSSQSTNEVVNTGENIPDEVEEESATSPRTYESQSILSNENIDKGFAGASQELREEVQRQTNISDEPRKRGILGKIIKSREDNDLSAQAELERERKIQQQQNQELEKARNNIKSGGVNPDTIDNLANERYNAAIDKLNNGGSDNS